MKPENESRPPGLRNCRDVEIVFAEIFEVLAGAHAGLPLRRDAEAEKDAAARGLCQVTQKLRRELDGLQTKFNVMRRNYESMSNYAHSDKAEFAKIKEMKDEYERTIAQLKSENEVLKTETVD